METLRLWPYQGHSISQNQFQRLRIIRSNTKELHQVYDLQHQELY